MSALARGLLILAAVSSCTKVPSVVRDEMARTAPGQVTVLLFSDYECPHCRRTHAALAPLLVKYTGLLRVVVRHVPLPMHARARPAARAAVCGELLGAPAMAEALFDTGDLSDDASEE